MRLLEEYFVGNIRLTNTKTGLYIGKCININNLYWYCDINYSMVKKQIYIKKNIYWL